jgi:CBS domain-containing protein
MENALAVPAQIRPAASLNKRSVGNDDAYLDAIDSAFCALTDFQQDYPITVEAVRLVDDALADMHRLAVHALLVTQQESDSENQRVIGLITQYDIERRHPHRYPQAMVSPVRSPVRVGEVMTACDELALVKYESLQTLTASELYEIFQGTGLTHLLVVEYHEDDSVLARGLVSRAALAKRLHRSRIAPSH